MDDQFLRSQYKGTDVVSHLKSIMLTLPGSYSALRLLSIGTGIGPAISMTSTHAVDYRSVARRIKTGLARGVRIARRHRSHTKKHEAV